MARKILKKLMTDLRFVTKYIDYIQEDFFENEVHSKIFKTIKNYFYQYKKIPTLEVIKFSGDEDRLFERELNEIIQVEVAEEEWLEDKCKEFILTYRVKEAVLKSIDILRSEKSEEYDKIKHYIDEALKVSFEEEGYRYFDTLKIKERLEEEPVSRRVPTGIRALDAVLEGGLGKGELGIVAGITGYGKTMLLQNFAVSGVLLGKNVIYYSFENTEKDLARRFDKMFTQMTEPEIRLKKDEFFVKLRKIYEEKKAELIIKFYPMYSVTPYFLKNDVLNYQMKGIDIGLVIVDYGQRLRAPYTYSDRWQELVMVYDLLASMALELNVPVWTAVQVVKHAMKVDIPDLLHVAGARDVMNSADIGISIAQTIEEKEKGEMRLFIMKARRIGARKLIKLLVSYDTFLIRSYSATDLVKEAKEEEQKEEVEEISWDEE